MTDRTNCLLVTLEEPMREDDAEVVMNAIRMLRHVLDVRHVVSEPADWAARTQERRRIWSQINDVFAEPLGKSHPGTCYLP